MIKKSFFWMVLLAGAISSGSAFASGVLQLKGKVVAYTDKEVTLEVRKTRIYIIDRTELDPDESASIKKLNTEINLNVPMQAVISAKDVKANR